MLLLLGVDNCHEAQAFGTGAFDSQQAFTQANKSLD